MAKLSWSHGPTWTHGVMEPWSPWPKAKSLHPNIFTKRATAGRSATLALGTSGVHLRIHKKITGKPWGHFLHLLYHLYGKLNEIIGLQAPGNYYGSICPYGRIQKNVISMISGLWDVSLGPQTNNFYFWTRQDTSIKCKKQNEFVKCCLHKSQSIEPRGDANFGKDGHWNSRRK